MNFDEVLSPRGLLVGLFVVLLVTVTVAGATSTQAFGAFNAAWDGASELRDVAETIGGDRELLLDVDDYPTENADDTIALVLSPTDPYNASERRTLREFVRAGGTLVVAEDIGPGGNSVLEAVGASARFDGRTLRDERNNARTPSMPVASNVTDHRLTADVGALTLNHGTAVDPGNATVLVRTSEYAYLDADGDEELDETETLTRYPVATVESVGSGRVVAVGDPSLFINAMLDRSDNRAFARALFTSGERVLFDYSHTGTRPPLAVALLAVQRTPLLQVVLGLLGIGVVVGWGRSPGLASALRRRLRRDRSGVEHLADEVAMYEFLRERHPDWDEERIRRVIAGVMNRRREGVDDD